MATVTQKVKLPDVIRFIHADGRQPLITPLQDKATKLRAATHELVVGKDLYPEGTFLTLQQMCRDKTPTAMDMLLYYQLRASLKSTYKEFPNEPSSLKSLEHIITDPSPRKLITCLYKMTQNETPIITVNSKQEWEKDFGHEISEADWTYTVAHN